jgi:hypothetical protein
MPSKRKQPAPGKPAGPVSFKLNILPLFRVADIQHMQGYGVLLSDYTYMSNPANAHQVYGYLIPGGSTPRMPMGGPYWTQAQLDLYNTWMTTGYNP